MGSEWTQVTLKEVTSVLGDGLHGTPEYDPNGDYFFINGNNLSNGRIVFNDTTKRVSAAESNKYKKNLNDRTILVSINGTLGNTAFYAGEKVVLGKSACYFNVMDDVDKHFIRYLLNSEIFQGYIQNLATGSTIKNVSLKLMRDFQFSLPPFDLQQRISGILATLDDRITLLRETNATLEAIAQALFKSWFVDFDPVRAKMEGRGPEGMDESTAALFPDALEESELGWVPKGWRVLRLGDASERITKGTTPTTLKRPFVKQGINFVKAESMTGDGGFIPEKFAFIDDETHALLRRSQLQDGDVLISIAGTIGRIAVMTKDFLPANTNQAVALIRPFAKILPSGWINRFLRLSESQNKMGEKVVQAVQANLSLGTLSDLKLVVPPEAVVGTLYESGLTQIDASWVANDQRVRTLATLRDTLLPRLISGQLRLPVAMEKIEETAA